VIKKLTLTIEDKIISQAKEYARKKNKSVSRIVEEYLDNLSANRSFFSAEGELPSPITDRLTGMFEDTGQDYKRMLEDALLEKYA
jgi:predicted metal-dependent peptidase